MKIALFILTSLIALPGIAQQYLPEFICPYNGKLIHPYTPTLPGNPDKITTVKFCGLNNYISEGVAHVDTVVIYKTFYTPNGDRISLEGFSSGELVGFRKLSYNKKGDLTLMEFDYQRMHGCGNYASMHYGTNKVVYNYKNDRLLSVLSNSSCSTAFRYDKHGDRIACDVYYRIQGDTLSITSGLRYRYDRRHKLLQEYQLDVVYDTLDPLRSLPENMDLILLRQFPALYDHYLREGFGISADSLEDYEDELPEALVKRIQKRDDEDAEWIEKYEDISSALVSFQYNEQGLLSKRMVFDDEPDTLETFFYDKENRLVKWVSTTNFSVGNDEEQIPETTWDFEYDMKGRISSFQCTEYDRATKLSETQSWQLKYLPSGLTEEVKVSKHDSFGTYSDTYLLLYDYSH